MKRVIQKPIIKVIQPAVYEFVCDVCGKTFVKGEQKRTYISEGSDNRQHVCYDSDHDPFSKNFRKEVSNG